MWGMYNDPLEKIEACKYLEGTSHVYWLSFRKEETAGVVQSEMSESFNQYIMHIGELFKIRNHQNGNFIP